MFESFKNKDASQGVEEVIDAAQEVEAAENDAIAQHIDEEPLNQTADGEGYPSDRVCDLVDLILAGILDHPEDIELEVSDAPNSSEILIHCNPEDVGKVIGKHGNTIKSIRTLARALGNRLHLRVNVEVED